MARGQEFLKPTKFCCWPVDPRNYLCRLVSLTQLQVWKIPRIIFSLQLVGISCHLDVVNASGLARTLPFTVTRRCEACRPTLRFQETNLTRFHCFLGPQRRVSKKGSMLWFKKVLRMGCGHRGVGHPTRASSESTYWFQLLSTTKWFRHPRVDTSTDSLRDFHGPPFLPIQELLCLNG